MFEPPYNNSVFSTITTEKGHFPYFGKCPLIAFNYLVLKGSNR